MLGKMLSAALVTMVATAPASLASEAAGARNSYVIALGKVDASNREDLDRVMQVFTRAARDACMATGSRLPDKFGPWLARGIVRADNANPHKLDRETIERAIEESGYQLWRMKKAK